MFFFLANFFFFNIKESVFTYGDTLCCVLGFFNDLVLSESYHNDPHSLEVSHQFVMTQQKMLLPTDSYILPASNTSYGLKKKNN